MRRPRIAAAVTLCLLLLGFAALVVVATPWHPLPGHVPGGAVRPDAAADFTPTQIARETAYHDEIRPWGITGLVLGLLVPAVLGFTPLGARLVDRLRRRRWIVQVVVATVGVTLVTTLVSLPVAAREEVILRRFGLSTQSWGGWWSDVGRGYVVGLVPTLVVLLAVMGLARRFPRRWWAAAAGVGAALVIGGSFVYPLVVEPVFNKFHSLPAGQLRTDILAMAARDHQPLDDILVSDASRRTTAENAHVSGFGASKRLVLDDTLLAKDTPREILVVAAHELGHAKHDDVLTGTVEGALAVAAAMCALFLLAGDRVARARSVPLLLAAYAVVGFAVSPLTNLLSRHIEARADAHALALTHDPQTFIDAQRGLAVSGLDDLCPSTLLYVLFFDHPSAPERIAMARDWERQHAP
ncbi:MAG: M48 family metallopeptidase [Frankiaceae bacterium]|nr:M48 family metallopeptidase [Frankiaceae bacterium]MBV9368907.1 M48 family metallopeptidase [Frankiales bacterium]